MLDLPTIKTDFLFENSQDFNQNYTCKTTTSHCFIHNISLYFNCISSVKYVFKWSHHSHIMPLSAVRPKHQPKKGGKSAYTKFNMLVFCSFYISKWPLLKQNIKAIPKGLFCKYFICYIILKFFWNNSKAKLVVTVS